MVYRPIGASNTVLQMAGMNLYAQILVTKMPKKRKKRVIDRSATAAKYREKTPRIFCAKQAAIGLGILHRTACKTLSKLADDGHLVRYGLINGKMGRPTQLYRWP